MDIEEGAHEDNEQDNNSKFYATNGEVKKFNIELTISQANALDRILPKTYSLQIEREAKNKRTNQKKKSNSIKK